MSKVLSCLLAIASGMSLSTASEKTDFNPTKPVASLKATDGVPAKNKREERIQYLLENVKSLLKTQKEKAAALTGAAKIEADYYVKRAESALEIAEKPEFKDTPLRYLREAKTDLRKISRQPNVAEAPKTEEKKEEKLPQKKK